MQSVLEELEFPLASPSLGYDVIERPVAIEELRAGAFVEAFGCGTAVGVVSIAAVRSPSGRR